ncbi:MAG: hypothetical protein LBD45_03565, partial [Bacteroidales bacterium]|nr:hypothetical protein [Bacteroidales bacterium]
MKKALIFTQLFMLIGWANAQVGILTDSEPTPNSALQVAAPDYDKGVLIPRLQTNDVGKITIVTDTGSVANIVSFNPDGLLLYNYETGCYNYWNHSNQNWWNLCGTPPPAVAAVDNCAGIKAIGIYLEDEPLTLTNSLQVPVSVSSAGTYTISASADPDNGYYFTASGTFPSAGYFILNLQGDGMPKHAQIDRLKITLNGKLQSCEKDLVIQPKDPDYAIVSVEQMNPSWPLLTEFAVADPLRYQLLVTLRVHRPGNWGLISSTVNGYSFAANGNLTSATGFNPTGSFPQTVKVLLPVAFGQALLYGTGVDNFVISTTTAATPSNAAANVYLSEGGITIDPSRCAAIQLSGLDALENGITLSQASRRDIYIDLPVNVNAPVTMMVYARAAGLLFQTAGAWTGSQYLPQAQTFLTATSFVRLRLTGTSQTPNTVGDNIPLVFTGATNSPSYNNERLGLVSNPGCPITIKVAQAGTRFTQISTPSFNYVVSPVTGKREPKLSVAIPVNVTSPGTYDLTSTVVVGGATRVTYSGAGTFTATGTQNVILNLQEETPGVYPNPPSLQNVLFAASSSGGTVQFYMNFVWANLNILSLSESNTRRIFEAGASGTNNITRFVRYAGNFGPAGIIK